MSNEYLSTTERYCALLFLLRHRLTTDRPCDVRLSFSRCRQNVVHTLSLYTNDGHTPHSTETGSCKGTQIKCTNV
jgi:hypothetical protein